MPAFKKSFDIFGDNIEDLSSKNDSFKNKKVFYDEKWLKESKAKLLKQINDENRANLITSRMKTDEKILNEGHMFLITICGNQSSI